MITRIFNRSILLMISLSLLLLGCDKLTQLTINEQQINQYLQRHVNLKKSIEVPGVVNGDIKLSDLKIEIGRPEPNKIYIISQANINVVSIFGSHNADIYSTFNAIPSYDNQSGAIYLKELTLQQYQIEPENIQSTVKLLLPYLTSLMKDYFDNNPAYVLGDQHSQLETLAKKLAKGLIVKPGEIEIPLID